MPPCYMHLLRLVPSSLPTFFSCCYLYSLQDSTMKELRVGLDPEGNLTSGTCFFFHIVRGNGGSSNSSCFISLCMWRNIDCALRTCQVNVTAKANCWLVRCFMPIY